MFDGTMTKQLQRQRQLPVPTVGNHLKLADWMLWINVYMFTYVCLYIYCILYVQRRYCPWHVNVDLQVLEITAAGEISPPGNVSVPWCRSGGASEDKQQSHTGPLCQPSDVSMLNCFVKGVSGFLRCFV